MDINFFRGTVIAIDSEALDGRGVNVPLVFVKSELDGSVLPIPWEPIGAEQRMPMRGQKALYQRFGKYDSAIVCYYGSNGPNIRKGAFGLNEGEVVVQSDSGLGYFKADQAGGVSLFTGDATSSFEGTDDGWVALAPNINLGTYGLCSLKLNEDGSVSLQQTDSDGNVLASITMDKDRNVSVVTDANFSVKAKKLMLDGEQIYIGKGATDPLTAQTFGDVETAGPFGTHPLDITTDAPLQGSSVVKVGS